MASWKHRGAVGLGLVALLMGCVGPGQSPSAGLDSSPDASAQSSGPRRIVGAIRGDPPTLSNLVNRASLTFSVPGSAELERMVSAGLATADEVGNMRPQLAEAVPSIENGLWRLASDGTMETKWNIRPNARWHDGTSLTSEDLRFTLQVVRDREFPVFRDVAFDMIERTEAPDPSTIVVHWKRPYIYADTLFTVARALPLPRHLLEAAYDGDKASFLQAPYWSEAFVGTGAFKLREFVRGSHVMLLANDAYVLGRPKIDEIEVRFIPDANVIVANVLADAVDLTIGRAITLEQAAQVRDQWRNGTAHIELSSWIQIEPQFVNPTPGVVADVRFRRALLHAIDRQQMADTLQFGLVQVAHSYLAPNAPEYRDIEASIIRYDYEPRQAARMLEELGYVKGTDGALQDQGNQKLALEVRVTAANPLTNKAMFSVVDSWQQLGLTVDPVVIPTQRVSDREYNATFPSFMFRRQPNAVTDLPNLHGMQSPLPANNFVGRNYNRYMNPEFDALIDRHSETVARPARMQILRQIMHHMTDRLTLMGLFYDASSVLRAKRIQGVTVGAQGWNAHEWVSQQADSRN